MTVDKQPEALRLADVLESFRSSSHRTSDGVPMHLAIAAELRRLHAELQEADKANAWLQEVNARVSAQRDELLEAAAELRKLRGIAQRLIRERAINREGSLRDTARIAELESQRNELLEALQGYMAGIEAMGWNTDKARSAIAKAEGANND